MAAITIYHSPSAIHPHFEHKNLSENYYAARMSPQKTTIDAARLEWSHMRYLRNGFENNTKLF